MFDKNHYKQYLINNEKYFKINKKARKKFIRTELKKRYKKDKFIIFEVVMEIINERLKRQNILSNFINVKNIS